MDNSTYPETETSDNCGFLSNKGQELDIVDHWVNLTIEDVISQGCKLREEKSKSCVPHPICRLATNNKRLQFTEDLCSHPRAKSKSRCRTYLSTYESGPQPYCSPPRSPSIKAKCVPRCPLRIAELAVPTKRQCIETWRNKCDVLPPFMVERLKQQVMDERPIAHIADAVNCFKRGKPSKGKTPKLAKRHMKSDRNNRMRDERMSELRRLCSIFGKKIAQKLITPQNLKLNPELSKISKIVADEVANMMKNDRYKIENMNEQMRAEISEKIAIWISTVMEDTSYKLLEEDLKVKKHREMNSREEHLITLLKLVSRSERTSELEEEEGPVLDFLDDVFDNVMNICNPQEIYVRGDYSEKTSQASGENQDLSNADFLENNEFDTSTPYDIGDNMTIDHSNIKLSIGDIQNVIYNVIDSVVSNNTEEDESKTDLVNKQELSNLVPIEVISTTYEVDKQLDEPLDNDTREITEIDHSNIKLSIGDIQNVIYNVIDSVVSNNTEEDESKTDLVNKQELSNLVPIEVISSTHEVDEQLDEPLDNDTREITEIDHSNIKLSIGDIQNVIYNVIDSVVSNNTEEDESMTDLVDKQELSNIVSIEVISSTHEVDEQLDKPLDNDTREITENSEQATIDVSKVMPVEDFIVASENLGLNSNPIDDSETLKPDNNTSDVFGTLAEESYDDKNKKVQFSDIDLGVRGRLDENREPLPDDEVKNNLETTSANIESQQKIFQPPNENLLSDADEKWPGDITSHSLKPTTSVSRSVTSLGNIIENEEKLSILIPENQLRAVFNNVEDMKDIDKMNIKDKGKLVQEFLTETTSGINNKKPSSGEAVAQSLRTSRDQSDGKDDVTDRAIEKTDKLTETSTAGQYKANADLPKGETTFGTEKQKDTEDHKRIVGEGKDTDVLYQAGQQKFKSLQDRLEQKFDYKVDPSTAPSWLMDHGKGEPSDFSIMGGCRPKGKLKESDIRFWCKDMESMFSNMDLWNSWLETTCRNILCLKRNRGNISEMDGNDLRRNIARKIITLKKYIDKDAILWTKLYERANKSLNTHKARMAATEYCMLCDCKNNSVKRKL